MISILEGLMSTVVILIVTPLIILATPGYILYQIIKNPIAFMKGINEDLEQKKDKKESDEQ